MDRNQHDGESSEELVRSAEVEPQGPPTARDREGPRNPEANDRRDVFVTEDMEPAFGPCLGRNEAEEARDERLDRQRVDDEDQPEESREDWLSQPPEEWGRQSSGAVDPRRIVARTE